MLLGKKVIGTVAYLGGVMTLPEKFCWSWGQMIQYNNEYLCLGNEVVNYEHALVSYHSFARNSLVDRMKGDWILMLDTDHSFEPDLVARMLMTMDNHNIDVLVGTYQYKYKPYSPVVYRFNEKTENFEPIGDWDKSAEILKIGSAGAGCLMVRKSVFDRIKNELKESPFDIIPPYSEDHSFFRRLIKLGIEAYWKPSIENYHLEVKEISLNDYDSSGLQFSEQFVVEGRK